MKTKAYPWRELGVGGDPDTERGNRVPANPQPT